PGTQLHIRILQQPDRHAQRHNPALRPAPCGVAYGVETVKLLLDIAFEELEFHRVWGARSPLNTPSARTMEAAGMVEEGTIREHVFKAGKWRDSVVHAILDREWNAAR
ncbi:GNAT family protein, partial [Streptomyces albogriseolus]